MTYWRQNFEMDEWQVSMGLIGCQYDREKIDQWQEAVDGFGAMQRERDDGGDHVRGKKNLVLVCHTFFFFLITTLIW